MDYSVLTVGLSMVTNSGLYNDFAMRWMQSCFLVVSVCMPLLSTLCVALLWLWPGGYSIRFHKSLLFLMEIAYAWSALDVFCVAIIASILEIKQFALFLVGTSCDGINKILAQYMDKPLDHDDTCFDLATELSANSSVLYLAALLLFVMLCVSAYVCELALQQRIGIARRAQGLQASLVLGYNDGSKVGLCPKTGAALTGVNEPLLNKPADADESRTTAIDAERGEPSAGKTARGFPLNWLASCADNTCRGLLGLLYRCGLVKIALTAE
jgi:hypothetical protein